jgi:hypothetical protein
MVVIIPVKSKIELVKAEAMWVLGISLGLLQLADQSVIHGSNLLFGKDKIKDTRQTPGVFMDQPVDLCEISAYEHLPQCREYSTFQSDSQ